MTNMSVPHTFPPVVLEKTKLNVWTIGGLIIAIVINAFSLGVAYTKMDNQLTSTRVELDKLREQVSTITSLQYQITRNVELSTENKLSIETTNKRVDRFIEQFGGKIETFSDKINRLVTSIEVLSTQYSMSEPKKRAVSNSVK